MFIDRDNGNICGAFTMRQRDGQEWLPDDSPELMAFIPSPDPTAAYKEAVQAHLDSAAAAKGYGDEKTAPIVSACSYASQPNAFQAEGISFLQWRSAVWTYCYGVLSDVRAGTRTTPSIAELIAELPALELPS